VVHQFKYAARVLQDAAGESVEDATAADASLRDPDHTLSAGRRRLNVEEEFTLIRIGTDL
jgi:hypothetical protein